MSSMGIDVATAEPPARSPTATTERDGTNDRRRFGRRRPTAPRSCRHDADPSCRRGTPPTRSRRIPEERQASRTDRRSRRCLDGRCTVRIQYPLLLLPLPPFGAAPRPAVPSPLGSHGRGGGAGAGPGRRSRRSDSVVGRFGGAVGAVGVDLVGVRLVRARPGGRRPSRSRRGVEGGGRRSWPRSTPPTWATRRWPTSSSTPAARSTAWRVLRPSRCAPRTCEGSVRRRGRRRRRRGWPGGSRCAAATPVPRSRPARPASSCRRRARRGAPVRSPPARRARSSVRASTVTTKRSWHANPRWSSWPAAVT